MSSMAIKIYKSVAKKAPNKQEETIFIFFDNTMRKSIIEILSFTKELPLFLFINWLLFIEIS